MFTVIYTDTFKSWLDNLTDSEKVSILAMIELLKVEGHTLARPQADTIKGSKLKNLKELRIQHAGNPYRAFFVFDPLRQAIILCGGDKTGDKRFYDKMIPLAEKLYKEHLDSLQGDENETNKP